MIHNLRGSPYVISSKDCMLWSWIKKLRSLISCLRMKIPTPGSGLGGILLVGENQVSWKRYWKQFMSLPQKETKMIVGCGRGLTMASSQLKSSVLSYTMLLRNIVISKPFGWSLFLRRLISYCRELKGISCLPVCSWRSVAGWQPNFLLVMPSLQWPVEDVDYHVLISCSVARSIWRAVGSCCGVNLLDMLEAHDLNSQQVTHLLSAQHHVVLEAILFSTAWGVWKARDKLVMEGVQWNRLQIFSDIQTLSHLWMNWVMCPFSAWFSMFLILWCYLLYCWGVCVGGGVFRSCSHLMELIWYINKN